MHEAFLLQLIKSSWLQNFILVEIPLIVQVICQKITQESELAARASGLSFYLLVRHLLLSLLLSVCVSFDLKWVSCRQHMCMSCFLIHSTTLCLLNGVYNPLTLKVIIDRCAFIVILLFIVLIFSLLFKEVPLTFLISVWC